MALLEFSTASVEPAPTRRPNPGRLGTVWARRAIVLNVLAILALSVVWRIRDLGNIPGINGDEAWMGVQAQLLLKGEPIAWRTPTGNPLNPFSFLPQLLLHAIFSPSFTLLRVTACVSGILALVANFLLCRRLWGQPVALVSTLALAVLPIDIAYSRFAWDASQSLLATLIPLYAGLLAVAEPQFKVRWTCLALAGMAAALLVHPTNLFLFPILLVSLLHAWRHSLRAFSPSSFLAIYLAAALLIGGLVAGWPHVARIANRAGNTAELAAFSLHVARLFSGSTAFEFLSGGIAATGGAHAAYIQQTALDVLMGVLFALVAWAAIRSHRRCANPVQSSLLWGTGLALLGFYLFAGSAALAPHFERYGIWMIAPVVLIASRSAVWWMSPTTRFSRLTAPLLLLLGWSALALFHADYFAVFSRTGGTSHRTFRTAATEPKQAALDYILKSGDPARPITIITSEWWLYWPIQYLALPERNVSVFSTCNLPPQLPAGETWRVEFAGAAECNRLLRASATSSLPADDPAAPRWIRDASGRPLIAVVRTASPQSHAEAPIDAP